MKIVHAVIKPFKVEEVKGALKAIGVEGMTVATAQGHGRQGGHTETYRGAEYVIDLVPKVEISILADDENVDSIIGTIVATAARTGSIGDGKIWVQPVEQLARIRTGERGRDAL